MYKIEKYAEGKLNQVSLNLFEKKMKRDKKFKERVFLYKNIDVIMQGAFMANAAKMEMIEKKIDIVATSFIADFFRRNDKNVNIEKYLNWS
jgi:hypothetical protein